MKPTNTPESLSQAMSNEMLTLFTLCPPGSLRRDVEDIFFNYLLDTKSFSVEERRELIFNVYHLLNFLSEAEKINLLRS